MRGRAMYVFKEFNRAHHKHVRDSIVLHLVALLVLWSATSFFMGNLTSALTATIVGLVVTHIVRISRLKDLHGLRLTRSQYVTVSCMAAVTALLVLLAFSRTTPVEPGFSWDVFRLVLLSLSLATYLSVYVDFAVASLFPKAGVAAPQSRTVIGKP